MTPAPLITRAAITGPGRIELEAEPTAPRPGPHDLVIEPDAVGICGTDIELFRGTMAYLTSGFAAYPLVPGHEWTGRVIEVGSAVRGFAVGDRVVGECPIGCGTCERCVAGSYHLCPHRTETGIARRDGALATRLVFPGRAAHRVPDHVAATDAALIEPLSVAYRGVQSLGEGIDRPLVVVGGGTIGLLCALVARAAGNLDVTVVDAEPSRRDYAASHGFPVHAPDERGRRHPCVIDASGAAGGVSGALARCATAGVVVLLGLTGAASTPIDTDGIVLGELTVRGSLGSVGVWPQVIDLVADGRVKPSALVSHEFPLAQAAEAFAMASCHDAGVRKVLIHPALEGRDG
ncbi:MAG TPA: alcohol dehydrogenase catalytic domain-containing protein [Jatrophihabitans sp.]|jgi:2-desacetyl-2-hydroxyethyl bacteriochlorophyllide A dehydrogenase|nr:alcohol dehydrogenase catalytic domain-containing protein [Jatrophihabitans sp.]